MSVSLFYQKVLSFHFPQMWKHLWIKMHWSTSGVLSESIKKIIVDRKIALFNGK